jgi:hypothetical protein
MGTSCQIQSFMVYLREDRKVTVICYCSCGCGKSMIVSRAASPREDRNPWNGYEWHEDDQSVRLQHGDPKTVLVAEENTKTFVHVPWRTPPEVEQHAQLETL